MTTTATRITTGKAQVTVSSNRPAVTEWSRRYFGPWWNAAPTTEEAAQTVVANVDPGHAAHVAGIVKDFQHDETTYANTRTLVGQDHDGHLYAAQPADQLSYDAAPDHSRLTISGHHDLPLALAAARLAREMIRGQLLRDGWSILHASAVVQNGQTLLTFGPKGAGKTTTALLLARAGWALLANDRVFARPDNNGGVRVLPWPSAAAIGFGLLDALDLYTPVRQRVLDGDELHPTQHQRVTDALKAGLREPLWNNAGKELKPQFFPDQLHTWLGLTLATEGTAAALLFPQVTPSATAPETGPESALTDDDFFTGKTEDRYPDIFGLTTHTRSQTTAVRELLTALPTRTVILGHDAKANSDFLTKTAEGLNLSEGS
ncbi:hypothetical protein [Streptomyces sp. x-80]|uniref:hypothetical protein n=1 Tax=Streptomyces sp. x-80 TaxID=2789282 RepID=UPI003980B8D2